MTEASLDLEEQIARIRRMREESEKFSAEQHKLLAEQMKLAAEAAKLERDRWLAPWLLAVAALGGALGIVQFFLHLAGRG